MFKYIVKPEKMKHGSPQTWSIFCVNPKSEKQEQVCECPRLGDATFISYLLRENHETFLGGVPIIDCHLAILED